MDEFLKICHTYYRKVLTFVKLFIRCDAAAQDVTQDIFLKLWKNRRKLETVKSTDDYIFILSRNACMDYFKKAYKKKELSAEVIDDFLLSRLSYDPDERIGAASELRHLKELAESLPDRQKDVFLMSRFNGLSNDEIASILGISKKSVENQLALARKKVKNLS